MRLCFVVNKPFRSSHPEVLLGKGVLNMCSKFTGEHPYQSVNHIRHGCSPVNLPHIFRTPFLVWLLLTLDFRTNSNIIVATSTHNKLLISSFGQKSSETLIKVMCRNMFSKYYQALLKKSEISEKCKSTFLTEHLWATV